MGKFYDYYKDVMGKIELPEDLQEIIDSYFDILDIYISDNPQKRITELHTLRAYKSTPSGTGTRFM